MSVSVSCPGCNKTIRVADEKRGKRVKCPNCATVLPVPEIEVSDDEEPLAAPLPKTKGRKRKKRGRESSPSLTVVVGVGLTVTALIIGLLIWNFSSRSDSRGSTGSQATAPPNINSQTTAPPANNSQATAASADKWQVFQHATGGFSVELPGIPQLLPSKDKLGVTQNFLLRDPPGHQCGFMVGYAEFDRSVTAGMSTSAFLTRATQNAKGSGEIVQQTPVQYQDHEGLDTLVKYKTGFRQFRHFSHRNAVLEFSIIYDSTEPAADRDRFFNSVQLTP